MKRPPRLTKPEGQPLQVYLDSSDYSVLGDAMEDPSHREAPTLARLCDLVDAGRIEIRFSAIHVVEIAHLDETSRDAGVRRARCIERLAKGKCFIFWPSMLAREQENFESSRPLCAGLTSDDGSWFPDISEIATDFRRNLEAGMRAMLKETVNNRRERRGWQKKLLNGQKLTSLGASMLLKDRAALLQTLSEQFPLSERFFREDVMTQFATGRISSAELYHELSIVFRDVEKFVGWTYETRDTERKTIKWFRDLGAKLQENVTRMRATFEPLAAIATAEELNSRLDAMVAEKTAEMRPNFILNIGDLKADAKIGKLGDLPAADTYLRSVGQYFRSSLRTIRKLRQSDSGDLYHLTHAPYCDIFRADGSTSQIATGVLKDYGVTVVPKLSQLLATVNAMPIGETG